MGNASIRGKISNFMLSDIKRNMTLAVVWFIGLILIILSFLRSFDPHHFIMALGVSLVVPTPIGLYVGNRIGWPIGLWIGLIGGLILAPPVALFLSGSVSAYYASFLAPITGSLVGRWSELGDKKRLKEGMDRINK